MNLVPYLPRMPAPFAPLDPPQRVLLGPGPSDVAPSILRALAKPTLGHLDPAFLQVMDELRAMLRTVFRTENELTFPMSGTGSSGMETCFTNLLEPGDDVLVGVNGVFGTRMTDVAERCGASVTQVVRTRMYVTDVDDWPAIAAAHAEFFGTVRPAATMVEVSRLVSPGMLVEIEAEAYVEG